MVWFIYMYIKMPGKSSMKFSGWLAISQWSRSMPPLSYRGFVVLVSCIGLLCEIKCGLQLPLQNISIRVTVWGSPSLYCFWEASSICLVCLLTVCYFMSLIANACPRGSPILTAVTDVHAWQQNCILNYSSEKLFRWLKHFKAITTTNYNDSLILSLFLYHTSAQ